MAPGATSKVSAVAATAIRLATAMYRVGFRLAGRAMPTQSATHAGDVFAALQRDAYTTGGWLSLLRCWADEAVALVSARASAAGAATSGDVFGGLGHDVRDAWRAIRRAPGAPLVIVVTLALGIGVNTAVFSVVDALLFKQLPYADVDRLVRVAEWPRSGGNFTASPMVFLAWRERATAFDRLEARVSRSFVHLGADGPEEERGAAVTTGYLGLFGARPALGRTFVGADGTPGGECAVLVSYRFWVRRLAADPSRVGQVIPFAGQSCALVGVLEPDTVFDRSAVEIYTPLTFDAAAARDNGRMLTVVGRIAPGRSFEQAQTEMAAVTASINHTRGPAGEGWTSALTPWRNIVVRSDSRVLAWTLFGAVSLVLVVACVNVAGLSLARSILRRREWALRLALGAGRWRSFRALIVEGLMFAAAGEAAAIAIGGLSLRALRALLPPGTVPPESVAALDGRALAFASVVSIAAALACATAPAWRGARANLVDALRDGRGTAGSRDTARFNAALLVAEIALAMILVSAASMLTVSFARLIRVDPGFDPTGVVTMRVSLPAARYSDARDQAAFFTRATQALKSVPGVSHASAVTTLPLAGWQFGIAFSIVEDANPGAPRPSAHLQVATDDHFATMGIPIVAGRDFTARDAFESTPVAIVNETFVNKFIADGQAVGRHILMDQPAGDASGMVSWEIVGVIHSVKTGGLAEAALAVPEIYVPARQSPYQVLYLAARAASGDPSRLIPDIRKALASIDPQVPAGDVMTMAERLGLSVRVQRFRTGLIGGFAVLAGVLACVGVFGVRARAVVARRREMGVRLALGAMPSEVTGVVVAEGLKLVALGMLLGLGGSLLVARWFAEWLFDTAPADPGSLLLAAVALGGAALLACWIPARRAGRVDPLTALRQD